MQTLKKVLFPTILCLLIFTCSKKDEVTELEEKLIPSENEILISGKVKLPSEISIDNLKIVTPIGTFDLEKDASFDALTSKLEKQVVFLEDKNGDILLASLLESTTPELSATSTSRALIGLMPWTAFVNSVELEKLLDEIELKEEFKALVASVKKAVDNNSTPLSDTQVLEKLNGISQSISSTSKSSNTVKGFGKLDIPEVDYTVEPVLSYSSGALKVENDGTTTAAWGVEVFNKGESVTGELILPGNKVQFPSLSSLWEFVKGSYSDIYFESSKPLEISLPTEDKFDIRFGSPSSSNIVNSSLSRTAAAYNIAASYWVILKGLGIDGKLSASDIFNEGCTNELFNSTTNVLVNTLTKGELTTKFFLDQVSELFNGSAKTLADCLVELEGFGFQGGGSKVEKYVKILGEFLKAYEKVEASFITGKLFGDMLVLNDIRVCRQFINGDMYPCFTLLKNPEIDGRQVVSGNTIALNVKAQLDEPNVDNTVFPVGAYIHWDVIEGDGTLSAIGSTIGSDGIGALTYTMGESQGTHKIQASVQGSSGNIIDSAEYAIIQKDKIEFNYEGIWLYKVYYTQSTAGTGDDIIRHIIRLVVKENGVSLNPEISYSEEGNFRPWDNDSFNPKHQYLKLEYEEDSKILYLKIHPNPFVPLGFANVQDVNDKIFYYDYIPTGHSRTEFHRGE